MSKKFNIMIEPNDRHHIDEMITKWWRLSGELPKREKLLTAILMDYIRDYPKGNQIRRQRFQFYISEETYNIVKERAEELKISPAALVRQALRASREKR